MRNKENLRAWQLRTKEHAKELRVAREAIGLPGRELKRARRRRSHHNKNSKLIVALGGKCMDCGIEYNHTNGPIFQYHHRNPETKLFAIGTQGTNYSFDRILEEAQKCDLLCSNCHFMRHSEKY